MDLMLEHLGKGFITMLMISMPAVLTAAGIGLVVGILQAVTQVQEQTIAAAPKILGVFIMIMAMSGFSTTLLLEYFKTSTNIAFNIVPRSETAVLPPSGYYSKSSIFYEEKYYTKDHPKITDIMKKPGKPPLSDQKFKQSYTKPNKAFGNEPDFAESKKIHTPK